MRAIDADVLKESLKELKAEGHNRKYIQGLQDAMTPFIKGGADMRGDDK